MSVKFVYNIYTSKVQVFKFSVNFCIIFSIGDAFAFRLGFNGDCVIRKVSTEY